MQATKTTSDPSVSHSEPVSQQDGNNIRPAMRAKATVQRRGWCFTINNPTPNDLQILKTNLNITNCNYAICALETGESGTPHYQGYISLVKKLRFTGAVTLIGPRARIIGAKGNDLENKTYCSKNGNILFEIGKTRCINGTNTNAYHVHNITELLLQTGDNILEIYDSPSYPTFVRQQNSIERSVEKIKNARAIKQLKIDEGNPILKIWQYNLVKILNDPPHRREIMWFVDTKGGTGKSFITDLLTLHTNAADFDNAKSSDIAYAYDRERVVIFDIARADRTHFNYTILEQLKTGRLFSSKYNCMRKKFAKPHIVVFSNWYPDITQYTEDRWKIIDMSTEDQSLSNVSFLDAIKS